MSSRLLVVDDDEAICFALRRFFQSRGYEVDCASELEEAQALVAHRHYGTVIADLRLTGIHSVEGFALVDYIRGASPSTRTILLTVYDSEELEAEARRRGIDAVLRKPQPLAELARLVGSFGET